MSPRSARRPSARGAQSASPREEPGALGPPRRPAASEAGFGWEGAPGGSEWGRLREAAEAGKLQPEFQTAPDRGDSGGTSRKLGCAVTGRRLCAAAG